MSNKSPYFINLSVILFLVIYVVSCSKDKKTNSINCGSVTITNSHQVEGYTDEISYSPGDTVNFKIHSLSNSVDIAIYHYGANKNLIQSAANVASSRQDYNCFSYSFGCDWQTSFQFVVPQSAVSGIYSAQVTNSLSELCHISFVVKKNTSSNNEILVMASTNTL